MRPNPAKAETLKANPNPENNLAHAQLLFTFLHLTADITKLQIGGYEPKRLTGKLHFSLIF